MEFNFKIFYYDAMELGKPTGMLERTIKNWLYCIGNCFSKVHLRMTSQW